ncbi:Uncharacterised protein [Corynebacterium renale]|uniref:hypothetical protein n=1 Tax=Corynebacterium renale TaxID=1724 RepID=UPI000DA32A9A|nr:hypothetical protein [Corynebacterium renale]SQG64594.1 Uncharacterised protein [Corynebacterium renale]STC95667.1 Uncharacterised protein [Corynebacterium renale]
MEHSTGLEIIRKMPLPTSWWAKVGYPTRKVHEATSASIEALEGPYEGTTAFVDEKAIMRHAHTWASENTDPALAPIAEAILAGKNPTGLPPAVVDGVAQTAVRAWWQAKQERLKRLDQLDLD